MKHSTKILLLLFSLSVLAFSQETELETPPINPGADSYNACDPNNRPEFCTLEYRPVCGYIKDCEGGACTSTFGNNCSACGQENVVGYVEGACEDVQRVCEPDNRPEVCTLLYTATCAVAADCQGPHCFEDAGSPCVACGMEGVAYYLPGACPYNNTNERTYCDPQNRPEVCTLEYNPVCAHRTNCLGPTCSFTAGNACGACGDESVWYHIPGECSDNDLGEGEDGGEGEYCEDDGEYGESENCETDGEYEHGEDGDRTYCDPDDRPEICTMDYRPVCAHQADCEGEDCFYTAGNACGACSDPNVNYHTPGEC